MFLLWVICPAYAGMIPGEVLKFTDETDLSRVCGDDPGEQWNFKIVSKFVPRMRG